MRQILLIMSHKITAILFFIFLTSSICGQDNKTQILIVGTIHEFQDSLKSKQKFPELINKLRTFKPDMICIESIPTWDTVSLFQVRKSTMESAQKLRITKQIQTHNILDEILRLREILKTDSENLMARFELANSLFANHDFYNAYYHWFILQQQLESDSSLINNELKESFALDSILLKTFKSHQKTEFGNIIFPLAHEESILHLENIDDRSNDSEFKELGKSIPKRLVLNLKVFKAVKIYKQLQREALEAEEQGELVDLLNSQVYQNKIVIPIDNLDKDWIKSKKTRCIKQLWYTRNERMAARITRAIAVKKPRQVIVFFGAAHIGFVARELRKNTQFSVSTYSESFK